MSKRNRITIEFAENGNILSICSDRVADVYTICNHIPRDRVYKLKPKNGLVCFGSSAVDRVLAESEDN